LGSLWDPGGIRNRIDFLNDFLKGPLCAFEPFRCPKGCQRGANGSTLGAHFRDNWKSENSAPACTGASFSGSEGVPKSIGLMTLGANFLRTCSEGSFLQILPNLGAHWVPIGGPLG